MEVQEKTEFNSKIITELLERLSFPVQNIYLI